MGQRDGINQPRLLGAAIPFILVVNANGQAVTAVPAPIIFNETLFKTNYITFTNGTSKLYIARGGTGLYEIHVNLGVAQNQLASTARVVIYRNGTIVNNTKAKTYIGNNVGRQSHATINTAMYLEYGDYIEIFVSVNAGAGNIEDDSARCMLKFIPMDGWINKKSGRTVESGGVFR